MDKIEVYKHIIESEDMSRSSLAYGPTTLERHVKALFDTRVVTFNDDTAPTICKAILGSGVEMTQKFHTLARRGADGDTRWIYDSYGYLRVQAREFYDRYVNGNGAQYHGIGSIRSPTDTRTARTTGTSRRMTTNASCRWSVA